jgi:hypothetical protein
VLTSAVVPLREPAAVDLRARLRPDVKPSEVQALLERGVRIPVRAEPHISLEEVDSDEVVVRITATPEAESDGSRLADEILAAIGRLAIEGQTEERRVARVAKRRAPTDDDGRDGDAGRFSGATEGIEPDDRGAGRQDADRAGSVGRVDARGDVR